eukprot:TRINITY_DN1487_c1_g1_i20.p1 TRINITY_DN1487_c1_g1~~TRINITY_DN1487_c1_g1_i20.p1  ORF type:complete len:237 (+),score=51.36 TRINITY_DN1487_c1_g1_i20:87-797(+)
MGEGFEDRERAHQAAVIDLVAATLSAAGPVPPQSWPSPPPSPLHAASSTSAAAPLDEAAAPDTASDSCSHVAMLAQNIATALRNYIATLKPRAVEDGKGSPAVTLLAVVETYADMADVLAQEFHHMSVRLKEYLDHDMQLVALLEKLGDKLTIGDLGAGIEALRILELVDKDTEVRDIETDVKNLVAKGQRLVEWWCQHSQMIHAACEGSAATPQPPQESESESESADTAPSTVAA